MKSSRHNKVDTKKIKTTFLQPSNFWYWSSNLPASSVMTLWGRRTLWYIVLVLLGCWRLWRTIQWLLKHCYVFSCHSPVSHVFLITVAIRWLHNSRRLTNSSATEYLKFDDNINNFLSHKSKPKHTSKACIIALAKASASWGLEKFKP